MSKVYYKNEQIGKDVIHNHSMSKEEIICYALGLDSVFTESDEDIARLEELSENDFVYRDEMGHLAIDYEEMEIVY